MAENPTDQHEFPADWRLLRFGDVATLHRGFDLPDHARVQGPFPVIGSNGVVGFHSEAKVDGPGVIIGRSGTIGRSFYTKSAYWPLNTGLYVKDFHDNDPLFVHFLFRSFDFTKFSAGVSVPTLNRNLVHEAQVCIPALSAQREISTMLSNVQAAVKTQEKIVATFKELKAATMAKLFREGLRGEPLKQTEIGEVPDSWEVIRLGHVAKIGNGSTPKRDNRSYWEHGTTPWLTSAKVHESVIRVADEYVSTVAVAECHLPLVRKNSIVVAITGEGKTRGHAALVTFDTCVSQHLAYVQFETGDMFPEFVLAFLHSRYKHLRQVSESGGSTRAALTCEFLRTYPIPCPSRREQVEIASIVGSLAAKLRFEESRRQELAGLFSSILHLLMSGQLRLTISPPEEGEHRLEKVPPDRAPAHAGTLSEQTLQKIVRRIVEAAQPEKIILFGSAVRGEMGPDSDVDLLVVKSGVHRRELAARLYRELADLVVPKDIIVATPEDLEQHRDTIGLVYRATLREGRVVYEVG